MKEMRAKEVRKIINELVKRVRPKSVYIYGSYIRTDAKKDSDIDMLLVLDRDRVNFKWLRSFTEKHGFLDLNILTEDEIKNGAHASFNSFYFINLLFSSIHVYGKDILLKEFTKFPDFNSALWRVQCILQRMRNILSNKSKSQEESYWFEKLNHWLYLVISEFLFFVRGYYNPNLLQTKKRFEEEFFELNIGNLEDIYRVFSRIRKMYSDQVCKHVRIRPGVFVLIKDGVGRYLMLERSDGRGFEFVKGGVEPGESFKTAALREVREEVGMKLSSNDLIELPVALSFRFPLREGYELRIYKGFLTVGEVDPGSLTLDRFFSSAELMEPDEIAASISFPEYLGALKETEELIGKRPEVISLASSTKKY